LAILLALTMLRSTGYGLQHQGPAVLILVIYSAIGLRCIGERWPRAALPIAIAALLLSLTQSLRMIHANRQEYVPADATDWIERNVPAGATVYWCPGLARLPLPTPEAADAIWRPLSDPHAYERKLQWGTGRMGTAVSEPPRVLGEDLMAKDRTQFRCWFILGGRSHLSAPRFNVRILGGSVVFGMQEPIDTLAGQSAVIVIRGQPVPQLGEPEVRWTRDGVSGVMIYCSPDIRAKLNPGHLSGRVY
jgi:hypothetical protein